MKTNEKPNYKKFEREEDKAFYAAYLNTAKQNVFITIRDISESLGLNFNLNNDNNMLNAGLWKKLASNKEPELSQAIIEKIKQKFPFANNLAVSYAYVSRKEISAEPNDFNKVFELLINQLNSYRNYYSHAVHKPVGTHSSLITGMKKLFDASRIKVKKRFNLKTEQVNHLVRLGRGSKEMENFKYSFLNHNNEISEKGFLFFVCLWLQRKDAQEFLKKHQGFKRSESKSQKATLEVFTYFSIRLPHPKLKSDNSKLSVFLDIINELNRCPKEIYPLLNDSDREKFKFVDDENIAGNDDEYEAMPILKRSSNRFFYFALRYLDSTFKYYKFHIDLGNYCFHVYDKEIEGIARNRKWIKRMLSFGNLEDFADEKRPREWKEKVQKIEDKQNGSKDIYVTETTPHYHINGNNIGIKFIGNYETVKKKNSIWPALPEFDKSNNEIPNPTKPANCPPDCWLSLYELPAIVFYQLLYHNNIAKYSAENIIRDHRKKIKKFFSDIENGSLTNNFSNETLRQELKNYGLEISNIPKGIIKHLTSKQTKDFYYKANRRLED
ncbi:MAG: hypothetical protein HQ565_11040, partial [Bacteroidetes bacterium]|nr:hypothetical protein [Bacteroidota bacterium]